MLLRVTIQTFFLCLALLSVSCSGSHQASAQQNAPNSSDTLGTTPPSPLPVDTSLPIEFHFGTPGSDPLFSQLPHGKPISTIKVSGSSLSFAKGTGSNFSNTQWNNYQRLKKETQLNPEHKVQWTFMDLDTHQVIARSLSAHKRIFGASSSKIFVAATLLDKQKGEISSSQLQSMADMLVVSSNSAWTSLQRDIGDGSADKGRELNYAFTQKMGYPETRGYQGYWGNIHGNELVPDEAVEMLFDTYTNGFAGAEYLWKIMYTCRTGASRGRKYIPQNIFVGGKTGTYDGPTEHPYTGENYNVRIRNHILTFNINGKQYGVAIFANTGADEDVALIAGGLIREYAGVP